MKAQLVLTQSDPIMAKVVLNGKLEYEIEPESAKRFIKEHNDDLKFWDTMINHRRIGELERHCEWVSKKLEEIAKSEDPRKELQEFIVYLNTPIAVA
jgi:hypothetical protein